jgi:cytochrome b561
MSADLRAPAEARAALDQPYDPVSRSFHWLVVALVAAQVTIALVLPAALPASAEETIAAWHLAVGSTILL